MSQDYSCPDDLELLEALATLFPDSSKSTLRSWVSSGRISVDGSTAKSLKCKIAKGQLISISSKTRLVENTFPILYSDDSFVVIEKPVGLLSVSTAFEKTETAFAYLKRKYYPRTVHVVHRLDQDTSGVMLFALNEQALEKLKKIFEKHDIERRYIAIVEGAFPEQKGTWQSYLYDDPNYIVRVTQDPSKGELAVTHFNVKTKSKGYTLLELTLETGKKNQIRVHCQEAGYPIVGDKKYGSKCNPIKRLALHAHTLGFIHPLTGKSLRFTSPLPDSFYHLLNLKEKTL